MGQCGQCVWGLAVAVDCALVSGSAGGEARGLSS
jgi:hypothetical protein